MEKVVKVKNISRKNFLLDLSFVTEKKTLLLKQDTVVSLSLDEYTYLSTQCKKSFEKGFLQVVEIDKDLEVEKVESGNVMSQTEIEDLMSLTLPKLKTKIADIDSIALLNDIRKTAQDANKQDKFLEIIDTKIGEISEGSILL